MTIMETQVITDDFDIEPGVPQEAVQVACLAVSCICKARPGCCRQLTHGVRGLTGRKTGVCKRAPPGAFVPR